MAAIPPYEAVCPACHETILVPIILVPPRVMGGTVDVVMDIRGNTDAVAAHIAEHLELARRNGESLA